MRFHSSSVLALALVEDDVVEHGLVERDRKHLLGAEADRVLELLRVGDAFDLEDAHADPVVGDAEPNAALRKLVELEEALERVAERVRVADLARDDEARLERLAEDLDSSGAPLLTTCAAAICEAPILRPTSFFDALVLPLFRRRVLRLRRLLVRRRPNRRGSSSATRRPHEATTGPDRA